MRERIGVHVPDVFDERIAAQRYPLIAHEVFEQHIFRPGERDLFCAPCDPAGLGIQGQIANLQDVALQMGGTAKHGMDMCLEFLER